MAEKIKKGDRVRILSGSDKGREGRVLNVLARKRRGKLQRFVIVEGVRLLANYEKANPEANKEGGIVRKEGPIHASNVALIDANGKSRRVGFRIDNAGKKQRIFKDGSQAGTLVGEVV